MVIRSGPRRSTGVIGALLAGLLMLTGCSPGGGDANAGGSRPSATAATRQSSAPGWSAGMATVPAQDLPAQARDTLRRIDAGGPFPYRQDGAVFGNRERLLPRQPGGYYHEYTVRTPGSPDRGARRLITGEQHETYYTDDHYRTFKAVLR